MVDAETPQAAATSSIVDFLISIAFEHVHCSRLHQTHRQGDGCAGEGSGAGTSRPHYTDSHGHIESNYRYSGEMSAEHKVKSRLRVFFEELIVDALITAAIVWALFCSARPLWT